MLGYFDCSLFHFSDFKLRVLRSQLPLDIHRSNHHPVCRHEFDQIVVGFISQVSCKEKEHFKMTEAVQLNAMPCYYWHAARMMDYCNLMDDIGQNRSIGRADNHRTLSRARRI